MVLYCFLTYQPRPSSSLITLFSRPVSRYFFPETYNCTLLLGCNHLFVVINFLFVLSISCSSFIFHLCIPLPYLIMKTAQVFNPIIKFLPFSLLFKINFGLLKYLFLSLTFISCSFILSYTNLPRYLYLFLSSLGNSILSVDYLTLPLFIVVTTQFLIPNSRLMSWLMTSTVAANPLISLSLFPWSFKSFINRRWLIFSPLPIVQHVFALHSTWVGSIVYCSY